MSSANPAASPLASPPTSPAVPPSSPSPLSPEALGYRIPSLTYRIFVGGLRMILSFVFFVALPVAALTYVHARGIPIPVSIAAVTGWGIALLVLSAVRYVLKPTIAFGPLSVVLALVFFLYLYYLLSLSPYRLVLPGGTVSVAAGYSLFIEILMVAALVEMLAGFLVTVEDLWSPRERLPFDYPV